MYSKTSGASYGNREDDDYSGLRPKKQKHSNGGGRRKVPRRGPGVAELEKIRLEEQHISTNVHLPLPRERSQAIIDKTGQAYPFSSYYPTGSFPNDLIPPAPVFQRKHDPSLHYLPPMNLLNQRSGGFYQFIEPTSNQTSCLNNVTQFQDEENILAAKRPRHFIPETTKCNAGPVMSISRDGKPTKPVDLRLKNHVQESGTTIRNPITIDSSSPPTHPTLIFPNDSLEFPRFSQRDEVDPEMIPQKSGAKFPLNTKPLYSFLPSNGICDQDQSFSLRSERYDSSVTDHGIDLRLKL